MAATAPSIIWDHIRRKYPEQGELIVDDLLSSLATEGHRYDRQTVVSFLKGLAAQDLGAWITGRRGRPSRIYWTQKPKYRPQLPATNGSRPVEMLDYPLVLRDGLTVRFSLPADLTATEAEHLATVIRSIPRK